MPLYDYMCADCRGKFTLLVGMIAETQEEKCPRCGSRQIQKLISRFARLRSEDDLMDSLADPTKMGNLDDPKELHRWMKNMGKEMGEDLGDDFDELLEGPDSAADECSDETSDI